MLVASAERTHSTFAPLRGNPRFERLAKASGKLAEDLTRLCDGTKNAVSGDATTNHAGTMRAIAVTSRAPFSSPSVRPAAAITS